MVHQQITTTVNNTIARPVLALYHPHFEEVAAAGDATVVVAITIITVHAPDPSHALDPDLVLHARGEIDVNVTTIAADQGQGQGPKRDQGQGVGIDTAVPGGRGRRGRGPVRGLVQGVFLKGIGEGGAVGVMGVEV